MFSQEDLKALEEFRAELFKQIKQALIDSDGHCKSYEGKVEIILPNYFEREDGDITLLLRCYLLCPRGRQHEWTAKTLGECCWQALCDLEKWRAEEAL